MNGHWSNDVTFLIIRFYDQPMSMPSNRDHAPRYRIEVSFRRESQDVLNDSQIEPS
jgi:hypothetical protein